MQTIFIKNGEVKKKQVALLEFPFDHQLIALIRTIPNAKWQPEMKSWALPYTETLIDQLLPVFKGKAWLDYSAFKKVILQPDSYATHLLEGGTDIRYIQELLGHNSSKTTEIHTHVSQKSLQNIKSPFDDL